MTYKIKQIALATSQSNPRRTRVRLILLLGIVALFIAIYLVSNSSVYGRIAASILAIELKESGIDLEISNPSLDGLTLTGDTLLFQRHNSPYIIEGQNPRLRTSGSSLLSGTLNSQLASEMYKGKLDINLIHNIWGNDFFYNISLEDISLKEVELLKAFGVNAGTISVHAAGVEVKDSTLLAGSFKGDIKGLGRSQQDVQFPANYQRFSSGLISPASINLSLNLLLPDAKDINLTFDGEAQKDRFLVKNIHLSLDLGEATASGIILNQSGLSLIELTVNGLLSEKGKKIYGSVLSNFSGGRPDIQSDKFSGKLSGPLLAPQWSWTPPPEKEKM